MAGHFPFSGRANRVSVYAFFEAHGWSVQTQERYYHHWFEWAKKFVMNDPDLKQSKGVYFAGDHYGQHAEENFHLHDYAWATSLLDLGEFAKGVILPKLDEKAMHALEHQHEEWVADANGVASQHPRPAPPEVGRYRHV